MKFFFKKNKKETQLPAPVDENDIIKFYLQLLKMKKKRPHINTQNLLNKSYPNATKFIDDLVNKKID
jgi:hypothetical protein